MGQRGAGGGGGDAGQLQLSSGRPVLRFRMVGRGARRKRFSRTGLALAVTPVLDLAGRHLLGLGRAPRGRIERIIDATHYDDIRCRPGRAALPLAIPRAAADLPQSRTAKVIFSEGTAAASTGSASACLFAVSAASVIVTAKVNMAVHKWHGGNSFCGR